MGAGGGAGGVGNGGTLAKGAADAVVEGDGARVSGWSQAASGSSSNSGIALVEVIG
jgi:hypothetical protein